MFNTLLYNRQDVFNNFVKHVGQSLYDDRRVFRRALTASHIVKSVVCQYQDRLLPKAMQFYIMLKYKSLNN